MHTDQDEISTMIYELHLLKRAELSDLQRAWIERLWYQDRHINLSPTETERLYSMHLVFMRKTQPGLAEGMTNDALARGRRRNRISL